MFSHLTICLPYPNHPVPVIDLYLSMILLHVSQQYGGVLQGSLLPFFVLQHRVSLFLMVKFWHFLL